MYELCSTCLSKHRTRVPLSTIEVDFSLREIIPFAGPLALVCWECSSRLQKMQAFKSQATKAQELLTLYVENKTPLKTLPSLSRLSVSSTKTDYDENFEYCMKQEPVEWEEEYLDDLESDVKYDTVEVIEPIPKAETIDIQESSQPKSPDNIDNHLLREASSEYMYVIVEPLTESGGRGGNDVDERPLCQVTNKNVERNKKVKKDKKVKNKSDIKTEPKHDETGKHDSKLFKDEDNIDIKMMPLKELYRLRDENRKNVRYKSYPFKCTSCITGFFTEAKYKAHLIMKHSKDIGPHTCDICRTRHARADELAQHRQTHFYSYHCRLCQFKTHRRKLMSVHQSEHRRKFSCDFCSFTTVKRKRFNYHVNKMHKQRSRCEICVKEFSTEYNYKKHMSVTHGDGATREKCGECGGMFRFLAKHISQTHAPAPPAPAALCADCGLTFKNNFTLRRHQRSKHAQQNNLAPLKCFECDECGYRSTNKFYLVQHIASQHMKQYPYNCDICHKGFLRRDRLKEHILEQHEGVERPRDHLCAICGKVFMVKQSLTNHILTHTEELRPHHCAHCAWSFAHRSALRRHVRAQHPGADTGNTGGAGGSDTDEGEKGGKDEP